jgi:hypothetical protein
MNRGRDGPLHALGVVHLWAVPAPLLPYTNGAVPAAADELEAGRRPVARHHRRDVALVDLARGREMPDVKGVEVVVLRCQKDRRRERGGPRESVAAHLDGVISGTKRYRL